MDDTTFQQELVRLKQRVCEMASNYQRTPTYSHPLNPLDTDIFHSQLEDLKVRLESMQASLSSIAPPIPSNKPTPEPASSSQAPTSDSSPLPHNQLALPSGPLFWQLFSSLRTDVRGLDSRVADLEHNVSDLDDRVSDVENAPTKTTPTASDEMFNAPFDPFATAITQQGSDPWTLGTTTQQGTDSWPLGADAITASMPWLPYPVDPVKQAFQTTWDDFGFSGQNGALSWTPPYEFASFDADQKKNDIASEGVAFRDREIAQMDEQVRIAQESIRSSDSIIREKDHQIQQLTLERDNSDAEIENLRGIICARESNIKGYREMLKDGSGQIEALQKECESKDADAQVWASQYYAAHQAFMKKKTQLCHAEKHAQQLQRELHHLQTSRQADVAEITRNKDDEIKNLREFFEAKEAIVYQQEQIIARGATLLEERDAEIERQVQQMKVFEDDYRNESRERARFARLLDERDDEITHFKTSLTNALTPKSKQPQESTSTHPSANRSENEGHMPYSPFATAGHRSASGHWTPKAINNYAQLPHEQRRAAAWEATRRTSEHQFGVPAAFTPPNSSDVVERRDLRRSDSVKLLRRLALAEEGGNGGPATSTTAASSGTKRTRARLPLDDDAASRPPLPARVPRRAASFAQPGSRLERDGEDHHRRPISRHQSIQDLDKRGLQPYVEEDGVDVDA